MYVVNAARFAGGKSSLSVINEFGVLVKYIPLPAMQTGSVGSPSQAANGDVFIPTDDGEIYRVDPQSESVTLIFREPSNEQLVLKQA